MQKIQDIHHFVAARMNTDSADIVLKENEYRLLKNVLVSAPGFIGKLKKMPGFKNVLTLAINSDFTINPTYFTIVGSCEDLKNSAIVYFACCRAPSGNQPVPSEYSHGIFRMFTANNKLEWIVKDNSTLNFQLNHNISAHVVEDLLYWTDGYEGEAFVDYNPPRKINMVKACAYTNPYSPTKTYYKGMVVGDSGHSYRCTALSSVGSFPANWEVANTTIYRISTYPVYVPLDTHYQGNIFISGGIYYEYINPIPSSESSGIYLTNSLYWKVIIPKAISLQTLDRIKYPPTSDLLASYFSDLNTATNNVRGKQFQFRYQYVYDDAEKAVWSPISELPLSLNDETGNGTFAGVLQVGANFVEGSKLNNCIKLTYNTGSLEVKTINFAVREGNTGIWKKINQIDKFAPAGLELIVSNTTLTWFFYNDVAGFPLDQADTERLYDFVPQISGVEELIERNRIIDGDYVEGFDNIKPNVTLGYTFEKIDMNPGNQIANSNATYYSSTGYSDGQPVQVVSLPGMKVGNVITMTIWRFNYIPVSQGGNGYPSNYIFPPPNTVGTTIFTVSTSVMEGDTITDVKNNLANLIKNDVCPDSEFWYYDNPANPYTFAMRYANRYPYPLLPDPPYWNGIYSLDQVTMSVSSAIPKYPHFKTGATHFFGIQYYDRALRSCGVIYDDNFKIKIPYLADIYQDAPIYGNSTSISGIEPIHQCKINWQINHVPPMEAVYYRWVYGGSNIEWFLDFGIAESLIDSFGTNTLIDFNVGILNAHNAFKQLKIENYVWQEGDRIRLLSKELFPQWVVPGGAQFFYFPGYIDKQILNIEYYPSSAIAYQQDDMGGFIVDKDGNKQRNISQARLVVEKFDKASYGITNSSTQTIVAEVYRPRKGITADTNIVYNEIDSLRPILNPHTANRAHSATSGEFSTGNCYIKNRLDTTATYSVEALEFSDYYTNNSNINIGRPAIVIENARRNFYTTKLLYSGAFIQDTNVNQLSTVLSSNSIVLPEKYGKIIGIREMGYTIKVLQQKKHTSIPIGRVMFTQAGSGDDIVGTSKNVLGEPKPDDSNYGTYHNSGIIMHEGRLYFPDLYAGLILMDSQNGIHPISSEYGVDNLIKTKFKTFLADGIDNISIYSAYDELYNLAYFSFVDSVTPSENFTIAFRESSITAEQGFILFDFIPNFYGTTKNTVTSWNGGLWVHNDLTTPLMNFYGTQHYPSFTYIVNKQGAVIKDHKAIVLTATEEWFAPNAGDLKIISNGTYREKQTKIPKGKFVAKEGKYYTDIPRNMLTHSNSPTMSDFLNGDTMRGETMEVTLTNDSVTDSDVTAVEVNSIYSIGS